MRISDWSSDVCSSDLVERTGLWVTDVEILRLHYAETLRHWRERFMARRSEVEALYDERFCRMWEFYLVLCEIGFRRRTNMVFQMQLTRQIDAVPTTRDYMVDAERRVEPAARSARARSEEHTSELQSLMRISTAVFAL